MSGLEHLGIPGGDYLREALTNCSDPLAAIEEFQAENGILLPSLRPALPFLDLHGVKRLEFHSSVLEELSERLIQQIADVANSEDKDRYKKLEGLLEKSFPVIKVASLRPVVMTILKHLPRIKEEYLSQILEDKELYAEAATEVKRQIWEDNQALFGDEVSPQLSQYIKEKENSLFSHENSTSTFFVNSPKMRRQGEVVQKLTHMVGKSVKLYDMVLQFLRTLFLRTRNTHYCTLRAEILMALHDQEVNEICLVDPCHKFTWCVDACIREKFVDSKRSRELQGFLDGIKRGQEFVLGYEVTKNVGKDVPKHAEPMASTSTCFISTPGPVILQYTERMKTPSVSEVSAVESGRDLSMILCDPYAMNTVALSAMKALQHCINTDTLPRENADLQLLVRMISLGLGAWDMIDSQLFREPKLETVILTKFLPYLTGMMVEDQMRAVSARLQDEVLSPLRPPANLYLIFIRESAVASMLAMYYALQVARQKDRFGLCQMLPSLVRCENDRPYDDTFLHSLISYLIPLADDFASDEFCTLVFEGFLLQGISKENVLRHILRLLWYIHHRLPQHHLTSLMERTTPNNEHSEVVHMTYSLLKEKIATYQPSPQTPAEQLDSPLMSVPVPTPAPV